MSLENVFYQPGTKEMIGPLLRRAGLDFTRDYCFGNEAALDSLIEQGLVVRPSFNGEHPRYKSSRIVHGIEKLENGVLIIPYNAEIFPEDVSAGTVVKKGDLVKLKRVRTIEEAVDRQVSPEKLREEAFRNIAIDATYVGYDWKGIGETNKDYKVVRLTDCINGVLLYENSSREEPLRLRSYDDCMPAIFRGGYAVVEVPSVSKEEAFSYRVRLSSLPVYNVRLKGRRAPRKLYFATWFDLSSNHSCGKKDYAFQYARGRREGAESVLDFHDIAAYLRVMDYKQRTGSDTQVMVNPFAMPTPETRDYAAKLRTQVLRERVIEGKIRRNPLSQAEQEILLWKLIALKRNAFY